MRLVRFDYNVHACKWRLAAWHALHLVGGKAILTKECTKSNYFFFFWVGRAKERLVFALPWFKEYSTTCTFLGSMRLAQWGIFNLTGFSDSNCNPDGRHWKPKETSVSSCLRVISGGMSVRTSNVIVSLEPSGRAPGGMERVSPYDAICSSPPVWSKIPSEWYLSKVKNHLFHYRYM